MKLNIEKLGKNKPLLSIFTAFIVFFIVYGVSGTDFFKIMDKRLQNIIYEIRYNSMNNLKSTKVKDIIIVEIDDKTLAYQDENGKSLGRFPFKRDIYEKVIKNLKSAGAQIIGLDIIFLEETKEDKSLAKVINDAGNIVIGSTISINKLKKLEFNKSIFDKDIKSTGFLSPIVNKLNTTVYSVYPSIRDHLGKNYTNFSFSIARDYYGNIYNRDFSDFAGPINNKFYYITDVLKIPYANSGKKEVLINYRKNKDFVKVSFNEIYDDKLFFNLTDERNKKNRIDFNDKIVLIGATAKGIKDTFNTPNGIEPGVYVHANMINTILTKDYLKYYSKTHEFILIFLIILLTVYIIYGSNQKLILIGLVSIFIFIFAFYLFTIRFLDFIINFPIEIILAYILSITGTNIIKYLIEDKRKTKLLKALSEYVSEDVANKILNNIGGEGDAIKSEKKRISIFFSDIAGFTTISEKFTPEKLVLFLNEYLGEMTEIIENNNGHVDKYEGDAIMAFWGHKEFLKEISSFDICNSALLQQNKLAELNILWKEEYGEGLSVRMGLHIGEAIVGNIGGSKPGQKRNYTALGDSANLASRLEGVNKFYNTYICASEFIYEEQKDNFEFRYLDRIKVKGKTVPISIYELLEVKGKLDDNKMLVKLEFEKALNMYFEANFKEALTIFKKLAKQGDKPSIIFEGRCNMFLEKPVDKNWNGVWTMSEK